MSTDEFITKVEWTTKKLYEAVINDPSQVHEAPLNNVDFLKTLGGVAEKVELETNMRLHYEIHSDFIYFRLEIPEE